MPPARTMHWFRWHHNTANDHTLRRIATQSHTSVANVVAVWVCVLESASENTQRGTLGSWDIPDVAFILGIDEATVATIYQHMQGQVLDGARVINWEKRNPKREDDRPAHSHRTPQNPTEPHADPLEEKRGEENKSTTSHASDPVVHVLPCEKGAEFVITATNVAQWSAAYPTLDLLAEFRRMDVWLAANPAKLKTPRGAPRFVVAWLARHADQLAKEAAARVAAPKSDGLYRQMTPAEAAEFTHPNPGDWRYDAIPGFGTA